MAIPCHQYRRERRRPIRVSVLSPFPPPIANNNTKPALSSTFDECTIQVMNTNNSFQLMKINSNNKLTVGVLALAIASMTFAVNGGVKPTFAQIAGITPPPSSSTDQGTSNNATSGAMSNMNMSSASGGTTNKTTVTRDTVTLLLEGKSIPSKGFLHLYDSTPYMIMNGHIALHIPCEANSKPTVDILIGSAPDLKPMEPELIKELSQPGNLCVYHVDVGSDPAKKVIQTDIAIQNPSTQTITFPPASGLTIGINEIMPGAEGG